MAVMNFCPSCGSPQARGANFCVGCGVKLGSTNIPPSGYDTRSISQVIEDRVAIYDQNAANALTPITDFDRQFTSCMQTKGYKVPLGIVPKLNALVPYLGDKAVSGARDWGIEQGLEGALGMALPELSALAEAVGAGLEVYDHAAFAHAFIDCALRAQAGGPGEATTQMLDAFPVPDGVQPLPEMPPAVPVLPPPPPAWQPMVVPMSDPAPAKPKSGGSGKAIGGAVGALVTGGAVLFVVMHLAAPNTFNVIPDPVVTPPSIAVTAAGPYACKTTIHGGFVYEVNCTSSVTLHVSGNVPGTGVNVLMDMPNGTMHGSAAVRAGFRGTIKVALTVQDISSTCTAYPSYPTTAYVYDGMVVNTGPLLASGPFTYKLGCK